MISLRLSLGFAYQPHPLLFTLRTPLTTIRSGYCVAVPRTFRQWQLQRGVGISPVTATGGLLYLH